MTIQSQPGDFIGRGQNCDITYTPANVGTGYLGADVYRVTAGGQPSEVCFSFLKSNPAPAGIQDFASLLLDTTGLKTPLAPGTYTDAVRGGFGTPGYPGRDFTLDGNGSNTLTGNFTILDFTYTAIKTASSTSFSIDTFDATFEQHSERLIPALFGTFRYRSAAALAPVPEASTMVSFGLLLALGLGGLAIAAKRKKASA